MRSSKSRSVLASRRHRGQLRHFVPRFEPLEPRQLLTAVIESPNLAAELTAVTAVERSPMVTATPTIAASPLIDAVNGAPVLYRHGTALQAFTPDSDTDLDRGIALRAALAAAQPGDQIVLAAATYDMGGTEHVEFPDGVTVTGAGKTATKLTSSCPIQIDPNATFTLNNQTTLEDLWLEGSLHNGYYQTLVGMAGVPTEDVTTYLRRVKITGDSDGIFIWTAQQYQYTLQAFDCDINTN